MHTIVRIGIGIALLAAGALGATARPAPAVVVAPGVRVSAERPEQVALSRWAAGRFEAAGLAAPGVEIRFHADRAGCGGHLGYARAGTVDVCTTTVNTMTSRTLLHEMSHIWLDEHTDLDTRERFLEFRRLREWNASTDPWQLRGYEQGAETIAWAIGERILSAQIPDNDPPTLEAGFQILTGIAAPRVEG
ncbi:MAG TPA: hypothetical protein VJZ98_06550 [Actinomycetota bacterium]|jgi:hypothetical protein|nr:hypothetical protein [Actinomycetota bacterium]